VQLELSNDYQPDAEYQGVLTHPHTTVLDGGALGHTTLAPPPDSAEFLHSDDWLQLPYGSCRGGPVRGSPPPPPPSQRSPAGCIRSRGAVGCGGGAMTAYSPLPTPASPAVASSSAVSATPTIKPGGYARHGSLSSSFSNLI